MLLAVVVAVGRVGGGIDHRPVGHVGEQELDVIGHVLLGEDRRRQAEALRIEAGDVALLDRVATAEGRDPAGVDAPETNFAADLASDPAGVPAPEKSLEAALMSPPLGVAAPENDRNC